MEGSTDQTRAKAVGRWNAVDKSRAGSGKAAEMRTREFLLGFWTVMAETKMVVVAFLLVAMLVASSAPAVEGAHCLRNCFARCPKETDNTVTSCHDLCVQSCIIPRRKR
ncbi:hypothetical protein ZIOFF_029464 [Zingiber officinale]|uniref:Plant thionin family protein n=1 Tax=Zingiber officinale TaxID=94328 RepID=A0A8J5GWQ4_ZINOF|nr:hypothetical protein ZIOFF_029464 [Zingiber officinale]